MSTHNKLDKICIAIVICSLILTALFINGESLGITKIVDEDAEQNSDTEYFTANDEDGNWDTSEATVITLTGNGADISGKGAYVYDGNVVITGAGSYVVSGSLTDGYLSVDAYDSSKVFILLNGTEINCSDNACIRVEQADKVFLTLAENSQNILSSGSAYSEEALKDGTDGAIFAHDDLTINGSGNLTVTAGYRHGIAANDDLVITGGTITVTAVADAIHAKDSLRVKEAAITVDAQDDGIVTSNEVENGYLYIESGTLHITAADDGIHTTGDITLAGGDLTISAGNDGIHSDASISISDGTLLIDECYEGVEALIINVSGGDITVYPKDDGFNANGNSENQIGAGGFPATPDMSSADFTDGFPARPDMDSADSTDGFPAPPDMSSADSSGGFQAPPDMSSTDSSGGFPARPDMDSGEGGTSTESIAASNKKTNDEETYITISGGTITIINETGNDADGLDSNGDLFISGGIIYVSLQGNGINSAVDYGSESGGVAEISGGTIIACGASSMAEAFDSSSTQASILYNTSTIAEAGTTLAVNDTDGNELLSWKVPCSFSSALLSCPEMKTGDTYTVVIGENEEDITLEEVSASYGDAQSSMFGGKMNWGGMKRRGGGFRRFKSGSDSSTGSTDTEAAASTEEMPGGGMTPPDGMIPPDGMTPPDMSDTSQSGAADARIPQDAGQMSSGTEQNASNSGLMQEEQQQNEIIDTAQNQTTTSEEPIDAQTLKILAGCTLLLLAGIAIGKVYKRH